MTPETQSNPAWQELHLNNPSLAQKMQEAKELCAQTVPFTSHIIQDGDYFSSGFFIGQRETGMICNNPLTVQDFHFKPLADPDYDCEASKFPFEYQGWDPKWYSPLCRTWYQE